MNKALEQLCVACGIQTHYADIWQKRHDVPEATLRSLLRAMGMRTENDDERHKSLRTLSDPQWLATLPPWWLPMTTMALWHLKLRYRLRRRIPRGAGTCGWNRARYGHADSFRWRGRVT